MSAVDVILYTRKQCSLCEQAKSAISEAASRYAIRIALREVDIDHDPALRQQFTNDVPVIYVNGSEAFRHRVEPEQFASFVRGAKPVVANNARSHLADEKCIPCRGGVPALKGEALATVARELGGAWRVVNEHHLEKE